MKILVVKSFEKDVERIKNKKLGSQLSKIIELLENTASIESIPNIKKMKTGKNYYRIRIGEYRLGFSKDVNSITLMCFMHRKEIYKFFP